MTRILLMEGNDAPSRARAAALGIATSSAIYAQAVRRCDPDVGIEIVCAADPGATLPGGGELAGYDGLIVGGSSLHAYERVGAVTAQIDLMRAAGEAGLPILGSCWGLQIAAVAGGGRVERSPNGREIGIARKIAKTAAGRAHPFLAGKPDCYDALCIHYDEVAELPAGSVVLASNRHSGVQAAIVPVGRSEVWAVQYHPEFDLSHIAGLLRYYADAMLGEGFYTDAGEGRHHAALIDGLVRDPHAPGAAWQLGIDADVLDPSIRLGEIDAWLRHVRTRAGRIGGA